MSILVARLALVDRAAVELAKPEAGLQRLERQTLAAVAAAAVQPLVLPGMVEMADQVSLFFRFQLQIIPGTRQDRLQ